MAAPADDATSGSGEKATFPWLAAARYAVAVAVAVLIVTVIARAIVVVLRRDEPKISVVGGFIAVSREDFPSVRGLAFNYTLRAINPSGRVRIYFTDILGTFQFKNATSPARGLASLKLPDMALKTPAEELQEYVHNTLYLTEGIMSTWRSSYFESLHNDSTGFYIPDAMLRLNGTVITEVYSGHNRTYPAPTVFCCSPLTIGGDPGEHTADDARCLPNDQTCDTET